MAGKRNARVELTLDKNRFDKNLDAAGRKLRKFSRDGAKDLSTFDRFGRVGMKVARGGIKGVGVAAAIGGVGLAAMAGEVFNLEKGLARFQNATDNSDAQMADFRNRLTETSRASGLNRQELLDGAAAYVALTGDAAGAAQGMALFAKVSNATGASMGDIAATAAAMKDNLGIDPKDFEAGFSALAVQGKAGAVELRELATLMAGIAPSFAQFKGGSGAGGLVEMGAALQVVRKGFGSSSEAATGLRSMMVSVQRNADKFRKAGVKIYDRDPKTGKKRLRDFSDIVDAIGNSKLARDPTKLTKAFGSDEAKRAFDQLIQNRALFDDLITKSKDKNAIDRDAASYLATPAARISKAWENVKLKLAEAFTPERIEAFAGALEKVVMLAAKAADILDALLNEQKGRVGLLGPETLANFDATMQNITGMATAPDVSIFKTQMARIGMPTAYGDGAYSLGEMFKYNDQMQRTKAALGSTPASVASKFAGAAPGGDAVQRAITMNIAVQVDGSTIARATANAPAHRTRPGGL